MKPRLPAPYTPEDEAILFRHGRGRWATTLRASGLQADIRDAELMCWLSLTKVMHYAALPLPRECRLPMAHLWVRIDPEWPADHHIIDLT